MLLRKSHLRRLIEARLASLTREDSPNATGLHNELTAMLEAIESLPVTEVEEMGGKTIAKTDPLETALDALNLKICQLGEAASSTSDYLAIGRLCQIGQAIRQARSDSVEDFIGYEDEPMGACGPRFMANPRNQFANPFRPGARVLQPIGAPYHREGYGNVVQHELTTADMYRGLLETLGPAMDNRAKKDASTSRRAVAAELESLLKARTRLQDAGLDLAAVDQRIGEIQAQIAGDPTPDPGRESEPEEADEANPEFDELEDLERLMADAEPLDMGQGEAAHLRVEPADNAEQDLVAAQHDPDIPF